MTTSFDERFELLGRGARGGDLASSMILELANLYSGLGRFREALEVSRALTGLVPDGVTRCRAQLLLLAMTRRMGVQGRAAT